MGGVYLTFQLPSEERNLMATQKRSRQETCAMRRARNESRRKQRQEQADRANKQWRSLSPQDQLAALDERLGGVGIGAVKQRARIQAKIDCSTETKTVGPKKKRKRRRK